MSSLTQLIDEYLAGVPMLRRAVGGLNHDQLLAHPIPGKWSVQEVVCHLADFEPILADRMKRVIAEDRPTLIGADEDRFAANLAYSQRNVEEELVLIDQTRRQVATILRTLPAEALQRVGEHNERGTLTLEQLLRTAINHIPHHVQFLVEKRQALGMTT
jgi:uncharacterized damage-inducible protein DinB